MELQLRRSFLFVPAAIVIAHEVAEAGKFGLEGQLDDTYGAVAVFADDDFCYSARSPTPNTASTCGTVDRIREKRGGFSPISALLRSQENPTPRLQLTSAASLREKSR